MSGLSIVVDDLAGPEVAAPLAEHLEEMRDPAHGEISLYARHGFVPCPPFGDHPDDPHGAHLTSVL